MYTINILPFFAKDRSAATYSVIKASLYEVIILCLQKFGVGFGEMVCKPLLSILFEDLRLPERRPAANAVFSNANANTNGKVCLSLS